MDVTAADHYITWILITADGRDRYRTLQHVDIATDGRDRLKTSLLQILKILASRRLSQLDASAVRLQFFRTLPLSRAVAIVAVALISNYIRLYCVFFNKIFGNIKVISI